MRRCLHSPWEDLLLRHNITVEIDILNVKIKALGKNQVLFIFGNFIMLCLSLT